MSDETRVAVPVGVVDLQRNLLLKGDESIRITRQEATLIGFLSERGEQPTTRDELLRHVWGHQATLVTRAVDLAVWRLRSKIERDPGQPECLLTVHGIGYRWIAVAEDEAPERPPIRHLPTTDLDSFVGRREVLAEIENLMASGHALVSVVGPPGVGKTRIMRRWSRSTEEVRPLLFLSVAMASDGADLMDRISAALGKAPNPGSVAARAGMLATWIRSREQPLVLVLDGIDRVREAAGVVASTLGHAGSAVIVTGRRRLGVRGERSVEVGPMPVGVASTLLRARASESGTRRPISEDAVQALVRHAEGIPLIVELIAGRLGLLTPEALEERLTAAGLDALHHSAISRLESTLDLSWDQMTDTERIALGRCGLFRGGVPIQRLDELLQDLDDDPLGVAESLREQNLVSAFIDDGGELVLRVFDTTRPWLVAKLAAEGLAHDAALSHGRAVVSWVRDPVATEIEPQMVVRHGDDLWSVLEHQASPAVVCEAALALRTRIKVLSRQQVERVRAAVTTHLGAVEDPVLAARARALLWLLEAMAGQLDTARQALTDLCDVVPAAARAEVCLGLGAVSYRSGRLTEAAGALRIATGATARAVRWKAFRDLAIVLSGLGEFEEAHDCLARTEYEGSSSAAALRGLLLARAGVFYEEGEYTSALNDVERLLELLDRPSRIYRLCQRNRVLMLVELDRFDEAAATCDELERLETELGNDAAARRARATKAFSVLFAGDAVAGRPHARASLAILDSPGDRASRRVIHVGLAVSHLVEGKWEKALEWIESIDSSDDLSRSQRARIEALYVAASATDTPVDLTGIAENHPIREATLLLGGVRDLRLGRPLDATVASLLDGPPSTGFVRVCRVALERLTQSKL